MYSFIIKNNTYIIIVSLIIILYGFIGVLKGIIYKKGFYQLNKVALCLSKFGIGQGHELILSFIIFPIQILMVSLIAQSIKNIYSFQTPVFSKIPNSPFVFRYWDIFYQILFFRLLLGGLWMIKFLNGYKNYLIVSLTVNKYYKPQIPSWRVIIHSIGHNIGT